MSPARGQMMGDNKSHRLQITLAVIGLTGVLGAALIGIVPNMLSGPGSAHTPIHTYEAADFSVTIDEDQPAAIDFFQQNAIPTNANAAIVFPQDPPNGALSDIAGGSATYTPNPDYSGDDTFAYELRSNGQTSTAKVRVTIRPVNDAPRPNDIERRLIRTDTVVIDLLSEIEDPDSDALSIELISVNGAPTDPEAHLLPAVMRDAIGIVPEYQEAISRIHPDRQRGILIYYARESSELAPGAEFPVQIEYVVTDELGSKATGLVKLDFYDPRVVSASVRVRPSADLDRLAISLYQSEDRSTESLLGGGRLRDLKADEDAEERLSVMPGKALLSEWTDAVFELSVTPDSRQRLNLDLELILEGGETIIVRDDDTIRTNQDGDAVEKIHTELALGRRSLDLLLSQLQALAD